MKWTALRATAVCTAAVAVAVAAPVAQAADGDTHIVGVNKTLTLDCLGGTLFINGVNNVIHAMGTCWAVTLQGSANTVVAETVVNDITVYGYDQTVFYHYGDPFLFDRGRQLGMTNRLQRVPV